ncbi:MAG: hypothetical protein BGP06_01250 [Rhizobiales bacterium 65-9]|nr:type II toxin-antitoxin system VapB family antitoxin [Hyphomicrobiales bacterium]OJY37368.1 MAG: hypothetical protein BGP06_01250 [Rhizobiales bacterium 65-9]
MKASSQQKQLNIRSDEAYELAHALARKKQMSVQEVVLNALQRLKGETPSAKEELGARERAFVDDILRRARAIAAKTPPGPGSDHRDFYDDKGFPK